MQIHELKPKAAKTRKKRVGRGGKRGTYSGHGMKGQRSRAGAKIRPAERDLLIRLPKLRGVKNKPIGRKTVVLSLKDISRVISSDMIDKKALLKAGLIKKKSDKVKILVGGEVKAFKIKGVAVSRAAKEKIEGAGGYVL